ncbi:MAG: DUF2855 family protein [Microscillaceae bacterium]|jgi:hypothetical protein|nr:DUF2855 family protein [Microscillaceae bacterium]
MSQINLQPKELRVNRQDYAQTQWANQSIAEELQPGEVIFRIDQAAFTANNITYAVIGEKIGYWQFFPTQEGWGIVPVWGFAEVVASAHTEVKVGQRFYGFFPMASHLKVLAGKVSAYGFMDIAPHRLALPPIYNYYTNTQADALYTASTEALQSVFRPLFTTSFLLDDFLAENNFFGATHILLTGASSKTALSLAFLLKHRKQNELSNLKIIGFTSAPNVNFVQGLDYYEQVLDYQQVTDLDPEQTYVIVDFSGNQTLQIAIQKQVKDKLKYTCAVGLTHWDQLKSEEKPAQKGVVFFAPSQAQKRNQEWGQAGFQARIGEAWRVFGESAGQWLQIEWADTPNDIAQIYHQTLAGKTLPQNGYMLKFN